MKKPRQEFNEYAGGASIALWSMSDSQVVQTCQVCEQVFRGVYHVGCVNCCARLVRSAKPSQELANAMLAAITSRNGRPGKAEILKRMEEIRNDEPIYIGA